MPHRRAGGAWGPGNFCPGSPAATFRAPGPGTPCDPIFYCDGGTLSWCDLCGLRVTVESYKARKGLCSASASAIPSVAAVTRLGASHMARPTCQAGARPPKSSFKCCSCGGNHTANYRGCGKWKEAKAAFARRATTGPVVKSGPPSGALRPAPTRPQPSAEQLSLGDDWSHVFRGGRVTKPQPSPQIAEAPKKALAASTSKMARSKKPAPKVSRPPKGLRLNKRQALNSTFQTHPVRTYGASTHC
jgi:hypothetical protein